jgi:hypothetical protein
MPQLEALQPHLRLPFLAAACFVTVVDRDGPGLCATWFPWDAIQRSKSLRKRPHRLVRSESLDEESSGGQWARPKLVSPDVGRLVSTETLSLLSPDHLVASALAISNISQSYCHDATPQRSWSPLFSSPASRTHPARRLRRIPRFSPPEQTPISMITQSPSALPLRCITLTSQGALRG